MHAHVRADAAYSVLLYGALQGSLQRALTGHYKGHSVTGNLQ